MSHKVAKLTVKKLVKEKDDGKFIDGMRLLYPIPNSMERLKLQGRINLMQRETYIQASQVLERLE